MKKRRKKRGSTTTDYILLSISENDWLFAVQRTATEKEQFVKKDPTGKLLGPVYTGVTYLVSPFLNYYSGKPGESCTCLSWRTRQRRCIHLKKFYEMNPELQPHNIYEDTVLHPITIADGVCDLLQEKSRKNLRETLSQPLEERACEKYREDPKFREALASCLIKNPRPGNPEAARDWLRDQMIEWAETSGELI